LHAGFEIDSIDELPFFPATYGFYGQPFATPSFPGFSRQNCRRASGDEGGGTAGLRDVVPLGKPKA